MPSHSNESWQQQVEKKSGDLNEAWKGVGLASF